MKKRTLLINIAANTVIIAVLLTIALVGVGGVTETLAQGGAAVYRGNTDKPEVSLMFNVYWGTEYIDGILKTLDKYGVKCTFFIGGSWAAKNSGTLKAIAEAGHEIASHGYSHKDAENLNYKQNVDELVPTAKLLKELTGAEIKLFAPPSGSIGDAMFKACEDNGFTVIMWSRDTVDWRDKNADTVFTRATSGVQNGELILMHPTAHTLEALPEILEFYRANGLTAVTVSRNLSPVSE